MSNPKEKTIGVRMPVDLIDETKELAEKNERKLSAEVRVAVKKHVAESKQI